ncbi:hypothetical protein OMAG_002561, partial [Candidatus Omnitrophus magneticus]
MDTATQNDNYGMIDYNNGSVVVYRVSDGALGIDRDGPYRKYKYADINNDVKINA